MSADANVIKHRLAGRVEGLRYLETQHRELTVRRAQSRASVAHGLRDLRAARGLSLRDLAPHAGCSAATLHDIEHCRRWSDRIVKALLAFYGVQP